MFTRNTMSGRVYWIFITFFLLIMTKDCLGETNYPPRFKQVFPTSVMENAPDGTVLVHLVVTDVNDNDHITISSDERNTNNLVNISITVDEPGRTEVDIVKNGAFERDTGFDTLNLYFIASDGSLTVPLTYTIFLEDVNDNPPRFAMPFYQLLIAENTAVNSEFNAGIAAWDIDDGINAVFTYELMAKLSIFTGTFTINRYTGEITQKKPLDYEELNYYQYNIIAKDTGIPPQTGTAELTITIADVQDTAPFFQGLPYMKNISRNTIVGTPVLTVLALDGDRGVPRPVTYRIQNAKSTCASYFEVNETSREIQTIAKLDEGDIYQHHGICQLVVEANEEDNVTRQSMQNSSSTTTVTFIVDAIQNNILQFDHSKCLAGVINSDIRSKTQNVSDLTPWSF